MLTNIPHTGAAREMFVLVTYDIEASRTSKYRKLLVKYLGHEIGKLAELAGLRTRAAWRSRQFRDRRLLFTYTRLAAAVGFPFPMRGWKNADPSRRGFHRSVPVPHEGLEAGIRSN